jgi:hypothetical protein
MEYRDVQYALEEDKHGWKWSVVLGRPPKIESGHAVTKGDRDPQGLGRDRSGTRFAPV